MSAVDDDREMLRPADAETVTITVCENGPYLVRGNFLLETSDREAIDPERAVIALCRCGRSSVKPFCDGTHALSARR